MKKTLFAFSLAAGLGFYTNSAQAQSPSKTVVVRVYEFAGLSSNLIINYGGGKSETIDMDSPIGKKDQQRNTEKVQAVLDRLYTEGYHLVTSAGGSTSSGPVVTFVFRHD